MTDPQYSGRCGPGRFITALSAAIVVSLVGWIAPAHGSNAPTLDSDLIEAQNQRELKAPGDQTSRTARRGDQPSGPMQESGDLRASGAGLDQTGSPRDRNVGQRKLSETSSSVAALFWLFALMVVGGSIFVITRRNLISAVMGMVGTFFAIAVVYAMLYAHFLAAIQVLVYAGAIMVLFVFVIMILNKPEAEPWSASGLLGKVVVLGALAYLLARLFMVLWGVEPLPGSLLAISATSDTTTPAAPGAIVDGADWGSTRGVGRALFTSYLFPFEAVSLVLLIAVVGAVAVARPHERPPVHIPEGVPGGPKSRQSSRS
ncbi:MAG: NADH-quinone oxidoreductase subunit J [Proteobacteria bacterium]|nr:NADH-quinone oxidoreductase subunit J [Pseudomonadota bacterium]